MKRKIITLILCAAMLCAVTACDKNEGSVSNTDSSNNSESTTGSTEDSSSTPSAPDSSSEESTSSTNEPAAGQAEFDFDEAVKNITLFGKKISLPCTGADLGDDFSFGAEGTIFEGGTYVEDDKVMIDILYKGEIIGQVTFIDCETYDDFSDKTMTSLSLGLNVDKFKLGEAVYKNLLEKMGYYPDTIQFDMGGLSFDSTKDEVKEKLGEPDEVIEYLGSGESLKYLLSENGCVYFCFIEQSLIVVIIEL
ncbi:MAG: hypothetical protein J1F09_00770 [Oscillospiraceae bacterium]|nr:hypothetical protein [Oscillospiraceae bacterium]